MTTTSKPRRYSIIYESTPELRERADKLARAADERWERERAATGRMDDKTAKAKAADMGFYANREHTCGRSKSGYATNIGTVCRIWETRRYTIPGFGSGDSLSNPVSGKTWEEAFKRRAIRDVDARLAKERARA